MKMANYFACMCLMRVVLPLSLSLSKYTRHENVIQTFLTESIMVYTLTLLLVVAVSFKVTPFRDMQRFQHLGTKSTTAGAFLLCC